MESTCTSGIKRKSESMGAYHGLAPTSASTFMQKPCYDVYINHRGPDVKNTLARSIYNILQDMKVKAFLDSEECEDGDFLPTTLESAMKSALVHIAILSPRYAESPCCLAELSFMLKSGVPIIPIFYYVNPCDLRWLDKGKGTYASALKMHEKFGRHSLEQLQEWKDALYQVSFYHSHIIGNDDDERRLLINIGKIVLEKIKHVPLVAAKHPVGLDEIVEDFEVNTLQSAHPNQDGQIAGIWGMAGCGKTTLAKEFYNRNFSSMEKFSFVSDVRDAAAKGLLHEKRKKLFEDLGIQEVFDSTVEGMALLARHLRSVRVLIVLDDVDDVEQLDVLFLLPTIDGLKSGSLIIVTTRAYDVLKSWGITSIYKMRALDPYHAEQLFCWHAFLQPSPQDGFEELVEKIVKVCNGLPLALKVSGTQLYGESRKEYWESQLHKISRILPDRKKSVSTNTSQTAPSSSASTSATDCIPENNGMDASERISPSVSTSATQGQKSCYDVFINHRGPDVKHLAISIYNMLNHQGVTAFVDSGELEYGDFSPQTTEAAMTSALLHIPIFSVRYAESPWCLEELSFMLKSGAKIIPIFYYVEPFNLRFVHRGKGMYAQAFMNHKKKGRYAPEKLLEWKSALHNVSFYTGHFINSEEDVIRVLKNIATRVLKEKKNVQEKKNVSLVVAKHPVGLKEIVEDFEVNTLRSAPRYQDVRIAGICGMAGSGKTTLAKELYHRHRLSSSMERLSFVSDVRDATAKGLLHEKQKELLNDLGIQGLTFDNIEEGMGILSNRLRSSRVLIVLDDVDNVDQLDALLPTKNSLRSGSLIIVTTRAYDVLKSWGITSIYKMRQLDPLYAKQLFCCHAFLKICPPDGFDELVEKFLKICSGLPLSLKVLGEQLHGEPRKEYWELLLHKTSRRLPNDIMQIFKISYDTLDDEEREMFLDTACFFIGEHNSLAIEAWNGLGWSALQSWQRLLDNHLVELDNDNYIKMHDHIRQMGREIADRQSSYRLWFSQQIINIQKQEAKRIRIQGIMATSKQIKWINEGEGKEPLPALVEKIGEVDEFCIRCSQEELMVNTNGGIQSLAPSLVELNYFVVCGDSFNKVIVEVSRELVWLRWFQIGQRNLPSGLSLKNLRVLELYEGRNLEELWGETDGEAPVQLRQLLISGCHKFQGFPKSIEHLNHLKKIEIFESYNVTSLPDEFCHLQHLEHLVLHECKILLLPGNFGNLSNLRHVAFVFCNQLRRLPVCFKNLMLLEHLNLQGCSQLKFTSEDLNFLENIRELQFLNLSGCTQLQELPRHITNQAFLRELYFSGPSLRGVPDNIGELSRLKRMRIEDVMLTNLPTSLGDLFSLTNLDIRNCPKLDRLPDSLGDLSSLTNLDIRDCPKLKCLPDSIGDLSSLTNLSIKNCPKLELPNSFVFNDKSAWRFVFPDKSFY